MKAAGSSRLSFLSEASFFPNITGNVISAKAGIQQIGKNNGPEAWMPACAGMTRKCPQ
jgi:hypothetical protein